MSHDHDALNRWLAEHVLGLTVFKCFGYWWAVPPTCKEGDALPQTYILPDPYRSFADCEPLLDKVERDGWDWSLNAIPPNWGDVYDRNPRWQYTFRLMRADEDWGETEDTRTAALCRAVASAYGWKEPHEAA
jgi:hypothetical protein